jgi:hypothetical protein
MLLVRIGQRIANLLEVNFQFLESSTPLVWSQLRLSCFCYVTFMA